MEFWILVVVLLIGAFCRLYKIDQYMTFLGDEGRDVIIVRRIFTELHPPLIGPGTSIGNMYLGPIYYYMMAPALLIAAFSPVGPAIQIALLGIVTIWFVWYTGKLWFGKTAGLIAALLYAISPTVIIYSRSSWNPNIMPFFALLSIFSIWKVWKDHEFNWLLVLGASFAVVLQSHYLGLLLVPTLVLFWVLTLINLRSVRNWKLEIGNFLKKSMFGLFIFLGMMSPLFFFDLRHDWMNTRAVYQFFTVRQTTVSIRPWTAIPRIPEMLKMIDISLVGAKSIPVGNIVSLVTAGMLLWFGWLYLKNKKNARSFSNMGILLSWLGFGLIGFGLYKQNIYDHYFGFLFPIPFLLIGVIVDYFYKNKVVVIRIVAVLLTAALICVNLINNPLRYAPNNQLRRSIDVANKILSENDGSPFDLAVLAERNYEDGYRYFLELKGAKVLHADRWDPTTISDRLFVVCEMEKSKCDPTHSPKAEVANFGWSKIDKQWEVDGVIIYRLVHNN